MAETTKANDIQQELIRLCKEDRKKFKAEFGRVVADRGIVAAMSGTFREKWQAKVIALAKKKSVVKHILKEAKEQMIEEPEKIQEIEETVAVSVLQYLLKDKITSSHPDIKICSNDEPIDQEIEKSVEPRIVASGKLSNLHPVYVVAEGMVVCKLSNMGMATSLSLLVACYYIFNMEYPSWCKNFFILLETILMDNWTEAKKRVLINKFLKELM